MSAPEERVERIREGIREDGTVEGYASETYALPLISAAIDSRGFVVFVGDGGAVDYELRVPTDRLRSALRATAGEPDTERTGMRELREGAAMDVLLREGWRFCDTPACNCDSWHRPLDEPDTEDRGGEPPAALPADLREAVVLFATAFGRGRSVEAITKEPWAAHFFDMLEIAKGSPLSTGPADSSAPSEGEQDSCSHCTALRDHIEVAESEADVAHRFMSGPRGFCLVCGNIEANPMHSILHGSQEGEEDDQLAPRLEQLGMSIGPGQSMDDLMMAAQQVRRLAMILRSQEGDGDAEELLREFDRLTSSAHHGTHYTSREADFWTRIRARLRSTRETETVGYVVCALKPGRELRPVSDGVWPLERAEMSLYGWEEEAPEGYAIRYTLHPVGPALPTPTAQEGSDG